MDDLILSGKFTNTPPAGGRRRGCPFPCGRTVGAWGLAGVLLSLVWPGTLPTRGAGSESRRVPLRVGLVRNVFSSVNANDAEAAFKVFCASVGQRRGYQVDSRVTIYESDDAFRAAILSGVLDMVLIDTWRFVHMPEIRAVAPPVFTTSQRGAVAKRYVLLTRRRGNLERLEDLRGREILVIDVPQADIGRPWLETLLSASGLGKTAAFFRKVKSVSKPAAAVLPVFFGQSEACVVDEVGFEVMKEMNPQVGSELREISHSEPVAHGLILIREKHWEDVRQRLDLVQALRDLHADPAGQQILTLFKTERLVPFEESHLEGALRLVADRDRTRPQAGGPSP